MKTASVVHQIANSEHERARRVARRLIAENNFAKSDFAVCAGVDEQDVASWLEGGGVNEVLTRTALQLADDDCNADDAPMSVEEKALSIVVTPTTRRIWSAFDLCAGEPAIGVIVSPPGCGKTIAATRYAEANRDGGRTFYASLTATTGTISAALQRIAHSIHCNLGVGAYRSYELFEAITHAVAPGDLIIIDEAQNLDGKSYETARDIYDTAGVGVVFMGNPTVWRRIAARFAQIRSRVGVRIELDKPAAEDVAVVLLAWGIKGRAERAFLQGVAEVTAGLRVVEKVVRRARQMSKAADRPLDVTLLRASFATVNTFDDRE